MTRLLIEMRNCVAQRLSGDLEQAVERPVHLRYEEYGGTDRQGTNEEHRDDRGVSRGKQPEARECEREPK